MGHEARDSSRGAARLAKIVEIALERAELSLPQFRVLALLDVDDAAPASALARSLAVSRPSVTGLVDGLVARGFVERVPDDVDRRCVRHALTRAGRRALAQGEAAIDATFRRVLDPLTVEERSAALDALALWNRALDLALARRLTATT